MLVDSCDKVDMIRHDCKNVKRDPAFAPKEGEAVNNDLHDDVALEDGARLTEVVVMKYIGVCSKGVILLFTSIQTRDGSGPVRPALHGHVSCLLLGGRAPQRANLAGLPCLA